MYNGIKQTNHLQPKGRCPMLKSIHHYETIYNLFRQLNLGSFLSDVYLEHIASLRGFNIIAYIVFNNQKKHRRMSDTKPNFPSVLYILFNFQNRKITSKTLNNDKITNPYFLLKSRLLSQKFDVVQSD